MAGALDNGRRVCCMSIWCSLPTIGWDDDGWSDMDGNPVEPECHGGEVRSYAEGWSNHYPTTDGDVEQRASIDLASIPSWCVPGHDDEMSEAVGPWLRLSVRTTKHDGYDVLAETVSASVVLAPEAVFMLAKQLCEWYAEDKVGSLGTERPRLELVEP